LPEQKNINTSSGIKIIMIMAVTIICNWTDDEPIASAAFREPEPIPDEIRTDWQNREMIDEQEDEMRETRASARKDIEMTSGAESTDFDFLLRLANPTDPAHVESNNLKYDQTFITFSNSVGPCRPMVKFPKNADGRSFQAQWYDDDPWLEYSPLNDAMHCFSCRNFMNEERFQSRKGWKSVGINLWRQAKVKIKEHRSSELHMLGMIRWNAFTKDTLQKAFAVADSQMEAAKERERQKNREIMFR